MKPLQANTSAIANEQWLTKAGILYENHQSSVLQCFENSGLLTKNVTVAGFSVPVADKEATELLKKKITEEAEQTRELKQKLNTAGITPIAILPEDIFSKIIAKAGFYSFYRIQPDGRVYGNGKNANKPLFIDRLFEQFDGSLLFVFLLLGIVVFACLPISSLLYWTTVVISFVVSLVTCHVVLYDGEDIDKDNIGVHIVGAVIAAFSPVVAVLMIYAVIEDKVLPIRNINQKLWPKKDDVHDVTEDLFVIQLPEPPTRVKELLAKCYHHNISTFLTVHPNAFSVVMDRSVRKALYAIYDPVIGVRDGNMVAVLDQFGDFPDEKEVTAYIAEHFNAIRKDILPMQAN